MPLGMEVGLGPGDIVLDGNPAPPKRCTAPHFRSMSAVAKLLDGLRCGQTAGWIKMPLGTEVGLCSGDIVLDGTELPSPKEHSPQFSVHVCCGQMAGCISIPHDTEVSLGPDGIVLDGGPAPPQKRGTAPNFRPLPIVANGCPSQLLLSSCLLIRRWLHFL